MDITQLILDDHHAQSIRERVRLRLRKPESRRRWGGRPPGAIGILCRDYRRVHDGKKQDRRSVTGERKRWAHGFGFAPADDGGVTFV